MWLDDGWIVLVVLLLRLPHLLEEGLCAPEPLVADGDHLHPTHDRDNASRLEQLVETGVVCRKIGRDGNFHSLCSHLDVGGLTNELGYCR